MLIKSKISRSCLIILALLAGCKLVNADPLLSASQQDLFKLSIGLKPGEPKDEPIYIEPIPCATWLFHTITIHGQIRSQLEWRSKESVREAFYDVYIINNRKLPSTSTEYIMLKSAIDQSLAGMGLIEVKADVLEFCSRYEDEYVTSSGGRANHPNPRLKSAGKR